MSCQCSILFKLSSLIGGKMVSCIKIPIERLPTKNVMWHWKIIPCQGAQYVVLQSFKSIKPEVYFSLIFHD